MRLNPSCPRPKARGGQVDDDEIIIGLGGSDGLSVPDTG
jgi:hypothetical protein